MRAVLATAATKLPGLAARVWAAAQSPRALLAVPAVYLLLLIIGTVRGYTPVPTHDMWEGALLSYFRAQEHGFFWETFVFWNEHRIVLSKLLFWLDFQYFGARFIFLTAANVALLLSLWLAFCALGRHLIAKREAWWIVCAGLSALLLSWMQRENLASPFQSQFLLAYLVPLLAFFGMARAMREPERRRWFVLTLILGAAALGTMANGLLVFPLLLGMLVVGGAISGRWPWWRLGAIVISAGALTTLWFHGYRGTSSAASSLHDLVFFAATFLAFPFAYITGTTVGGLFGAALYLGGLVYVLHRCWVTRAHLDPHAHALLALIAYVLATAVMTAYGRADELTNAALVSRYATPSLVAWAALALLLAATLQQRPHADRLFACVSVAVSLILFPIQLTRPLGDEGPALVHGSLRAALAFALDIPDPKAAAWIFHVKSGEQYEVLRDIAAQLEASHKSVFADPMWFDAVARLGESSATGYRACENGVEGVDVIPGEQRYRAVYGWAVDLETVRQPRFVYFATDGKIVGLAVRGAPRSDIVDVFYPRNGNRGFDGYIAASSAGRFDVLCPSPP